jgi:hypothetical protein
MRTKTLTPALSRKRERGSFNSLSHLRERERFDALSRLRDRAGVRVSELELP